MKKEQYLLLAPIVAILLVSILALPFVYLLNFSDSAKELSKKSSEEYAIRAKSFECTVMIQFQDGEIQSRIFQVDDKIDFEVIDGCLTNTNGVNESICCFVKQIISIKYVSKANGKTYEL